MANGHLHPLKMCVGEARAAVSLGTTIYEQSPVLDIEHGSRPRVVTEHGAVTADFVVLAGNAYHALGGKLRGIMFPVNSFIIATKPLPEETVRQINPRDLAVCDPNFVLEYFRLSADKRLLFGGRCNYFGSDPEVIKKNLRPRLAKIYPELANVELDYAWGGTIGVPPQPRAAAWPARAQRFLLPGLLGSRGQRHAPGRPDHGGCRGRYRRTV